MNDDDLFDSLFDELKESDPYQEHYLTEEVDHEILKQRDAHFAGDFKVMHQFYQTDSFRLHPDIELERIEYLAQVEAELNQNLSDTLLTKQEQDQVQNCLQAYEKLKELYLKEEKGNEIARLIADLILVEDDEAEKEVAQVVAEGKKIVPALLKIISTNEAYDPLFPGYGYAPYYATLCLGKINDPKAIIPLFEQLERENLFDEQVTLEALKALGEPAKQYLLSVIRSRPISKDNIHAAYALTLFAEDFEVAQAAFEQLQQEETLKNALFTTYLIFNLEALKNSPLQKPFLTWLSKASLSRPAREELDAIVAGWISSKKK